MYIFSFLLVAVDRVFFSRLLRQLRCSLVPGFGRLGVFRHNGSFFFWIGFQCSMPIHIHIQESVKYSLMRDKLASSVVQTFSLGFYTWALVACCFEFHKALSYVRPSPLHPHNPLQCHSFFHFFILIFTFHKSSTIHLPTRALRPLPPATCRCNHHFNGNNHFLGENIALHYTENQTTRSNPKIVLFFLSLLSIRYTWYPPPQECFASSEKK